MNQKILEANKLMSGGNEEQSKKIILELVKENPTDKNIYADGVNILVMGNLYKEAKSLFVEYKMKTGKDLDSFGGPDISLKDIEAKLKQQESGATKKSIEEFKEFKSKSIFNKVKDIKIYADHIELEQRGQHYSYKWGEIISAKITNDKTYIGRGNNSLMLSHRITLLTKNQMFRIVVFPTFSTYFENEGELISELKKHLNLVQEKQKMTAKGWVLTIIFFGIIAFIFFYSLYKQTHP